MNTKVMKLACLAGLICAGWTTFADPLKRGDVAAEPVWVLHVDCDALRPTTIGQYIQGEMDKPEAQAKLAAFHALFSFDLRTQLHGLTLYSTGPAPEDGVLTVYAEFDPGRLVTLAKAAQDSHETQYKQHTIYDWIDEHKKSKNGVKPRTYAAILGPRIIFAQKEERVAQALDVLTGAVPNLASTQLFPQLGAVGETSFVQGAARKLDFKSSDPNAAIFRLSKLVRFQLGETQGQLSAVLTLEANDEEVATNMFSIAQGLVSLMKLQKDKPEPARIAQAITIKQEGPGLLVSLTLPANEVIDMMKVDAARKAQKKAAKEKQE
jgi:hypothetical protein